jgi:ubiquinone/menaquinone biosynthesis C-methylase UbiE
MAMLTDLASRSLRALKRLESSLPQLEAPRRALTVAALQLESNMPVKPVTRLRQMVFGNGPSAAIVPPAGGAVFPHALVGQDSMPRFEDLSEVFPDSEVPPLDRASVDEARLTRDQLHWRRYGYLVLNSVLPPELIEAYLALRKRENIGLGGFENVVWEGTHPEIMALGTYAPLADKIRELFGEDLAFNFTLTQFTSTEREWHQDDYLGADGVYGRYCALWMALDDIHPDSGPFEFIPGSHRWPGVRGRLVRNYLEPQARSWQGLPGDGGHWAKIAEPFTTPAFEDKIARESLPLYTFLPRRGDVLIWHGKLMHRGSKPKIPGMPRPTLICHYYPLDIGSGAGGSRRPARHQGGGYYWPQKEPPVTAPIPDPIQHAFAGLTDAQWRAVLLRSVKERVIDGVPMPGFPDPQTQVLYTSRSNEDALEEALAFRAVAKASCATFSRPISGATRLLDFGVGWGRIVRTFANDISGRNLYGVDLNASILERCRAVMTVGKYTQCQHGQPLDFPGGFFDLITAFSVFSHLSEKTHLTWLKELHRVLKPGGLAVITTLSGRFVAECTTAAANPDASAWSRERAKIVIEAFPDWRRQLGEHRPETFFYLPAGGGFEGMEAEHYGWAMIRPEYARKHWASLFEIVDFKDDPKLCEQAIFVLRKLV